MKVKEEASCRRLTVHKFRAADSTEMIRKSIGLENTRALAQTPLLLSQPSHRRRRQSTDSPGQKISRPSDEESLTDFSQSLLWWCCQSFCLCLAFDQVDYITPALVFFIFFQAWCSIPQSPRDHLHVVGMLQLMSLT